MCGAMKKYWWIALILVFALAVPAAASQAVKIYINGQEMKTDVPAQIVNGRTMVPLRAIAEYFGKAVNWDPKSNTVSIAGPTNLDVVSAISAEWATAGHATPGEPLSYAGIRAGCQPCHSGVGLQRGLSDKPFNPAFKANTDGTYSFDPHSAEMPTPIDCATCHSGTGAQLMKTGVIPGKLNVFAPGTDWKVGNANALCFTCHNGRRNVKAIYDSWATPGATKQRSYPHHAPGALVTGKGGMEYPGVTYAHTTAHENLGCVGCHMPKTRDGYVSHKFSEVSIETCQKCHAGQTDVIAGGRVKKELEEKLAELEKLLLAKVPGAAKIGISNEDFPFVDKDGKLLDIKNMPPEVLVGAYNYAIVKQELELFGKGAHNPSYAKSLLDESIKRLK